MNKQISAQSTRWPCIICETEDDVSNLQRVRTGIGTLISNSECLEESELLQRLRNAEPNIKELKIYAHKECRIEIKD